ncbi:chemotaxis protein CheW [Marinitoga sp. 1155]|uniref:chemotaxis protein CheW n=1 Tax=Marinitoga sp. 1155 TaxID=1428448 RepID=UPI000640C30E|nr:chemotaxis protein CheW [Marinitoga sp. 1155]KLO23367.1 hypothetical protein X274_06540 [Marinitoga sp. 1155]
MPQYITIILNKEKYALNMENVQEVIKKYNIVKIPGADDYIIGIINLRDKTIPIMNLKNKLNLKGVITDDYKIVILTKKGNKLGVIVDDTTEIINVEKQNIEKLKNSEFYSNVIRANNNVYKVIDIDKIFDINLKNLVEKDEKDKEKIHENLIQILKFKLGNEIMAIPVENVQEIVKKPEIYTVPDMPEFIKGVTSLRGEIIQIIDLNSIFKKRDINLKELIITKINGIKFGLHVEEIKNIVSIKEEDINKLPITSKNSKIIGVIHLRDEIIALLNLEKIFDELGLTIKEDLLKEEKIIEKSEESKLYLIFKLLKEHYAIEIEKVREVTVVEKTTDVVNIRGEVIPLIDLNQIFYKKNNNSKNVVIIKGQNKDYGLIVDEVDEIKRAEIHEIESVPEEIQSSTSSGKYLKNIINKKDLLIFVLDPEKITQ